MLAAILIAIFLGGGVSYAAEVSLPGDSLYWVKTEVNEEVGDWFAVTNRAQLEWDARKVGRRFEEAAALAIESRLDVDARAELEARVAESLEEFEARIEKVREDDADVAHRTTADFEASLRAYENVLGRIEARENGETGAVRGRAGAAVSALADLRGDLEADANATARAATYFQAASEAKAEAAKRKVEQARDAIEGAEADAEATADAEASLKLAEDAYAEGDAKVSIESYAEAFRSYQEAHSLAQEAKLIVMVGERATSSGARGDADGRATTTGSAGGSATGTVNTNRDGQKRATTSVDANLDLNVDAGVKANGNSAGATGSANANVSAGGVLRVN